MAGIFLSYAHEDRGCAERLARVLETAGHEVWWDKRLDGGQEFSAEIEAALDRSDAVVVAWSQESVKSRWVRDEAAVGCDTGRLVPVSIDGSLPPMGFRQIHTLDLSGWKAGKRDGRTAQFLESVERRLARAEEFPPTRPAQPRWRLALSPGRRRWALAAMLALVIAMGAGLMLWKASQSTELVKPTIALLPFTSPSPDPQLREIRSQARESLAQTFSQSGLPLRLLNSDAEAKRAGVDFLMVGDVSKRGDKIMATIRLEDAAQGVTVYSQRLEADGQSVRDLPDRIGAQLAGDLSWSSPLMILDRRHPLDPTQMAALFATQQSEDPLQGYQMARRAASDMPNIAAAQIALAYNTAFALSFIPLEERADAVTNARRAADRAISLQPDNGDTYSTWCILHSETLIAECEDRLREGRRISPDASFVNTFLSHILRGAGRFEEATDLARLSYTHDIYFPNKIAWMLRMLEYSGDREEARRVYAQATRWYPDAKDLLFRNRLFGLIDRGDFLAILKLERDLGKDKLPRNYQSSGPLVAALEAKSIPAMRRACREAGPINVRCMLTFAMIGDLDDAYRIAGEMYVPRLGSTPAETERIWLEDPTFVPAEFITSPAAAPMRRDPRYLPLVERLGLLAYWETGRRPDFCRKDPEPICGQLLGHRR